MRPKGIVGGRHAAEQKGTGIGSFWFQCNYFGRKAAASSAIAPALLLYRPSMDICSRPLPTSL
jgi:hypothetical protein